MRVNVERTSNLVLHPHPPHTNTHNATVAGTPDSFSGIPDFEYRPWNQESRSLSQSFIAAPKQQWDNPQYLPITNILSLNGCPTEEESLNKPKYNRQHTRPHFMYMSWLILQIYSIVLLSSSFTF